VNPRILSHRATTALGLRRGAVRLADPDGAADTVGGRRPLAAGKPSSSLALS